MKIKKLFTSLALVAPLATIVPFVTSCNNNQAEPEIGSAEEYIKDRTFGICGFDDTQSNTAGTGWILSDSTPDVRNDYRYYIATNWHVKYGIVDTYSSTKLGYWADGFTKGTYMLFRSFTWVTDPNEFCYTKNNTETAIDLWIVEVDFGAASTLNTITKTKLDKLNNQQISKGYINKFVQSNTSSNFIRSEMYCGGYPVYNSYQTWKFESLKSNFTLYTDKTTKDDGHSIDNTNPQLATIFDISPQYQTNQNNVFECEKKGTEYVPINWSLVGGASGSMLITMQDSEWAIVGIYWGGFTYKLESSETVYFSPCWSVFNSNHKDFVRNYLKK